MSPWITIYQFPLDKNLAELARFIQRYRLPLRISEENNRQLVSTADPQLRDLLLPLLQRWDAGEIDLSSVRLEPAPGEPVPAETEADTIKGEENEYRKHVSPLPSWPWKKTPLSLLLIALCFIGWFLVGQGLEGAFIIYPDRSGVFDLGSIHEALGSIHRSLGSSTLAWHFSHGEYWRLWTPAILHFSLPHALFNALSIWILGRPLEARAGTPAFALLVLISAALANLAQYLWSPGIPFGGMSGVVYALVGAVFVLQRWQPAWRDVPAGLVTLAVVWLLAAASGLVTLIFGVGVANAAHTGGFVCGIMLALLYCLAGGAKKLGSE